MQVTKRDGTLQNLDRSKIDKAIANAFKACGYDFSDAKIREIASDVQVWDSIPVETIQDEIEETLLDYDYLDVFKAFSGYRAYRKRIRDYALKKQQFIENYKNSDNTANATIDDNSNVSNHNIAVLNSEIHKEENAEVNLSIWEHKLAELYPDFDSKQLRKDINTICYAHDLSSQIGMPYCVAITMYPFLLHGIEDIGGLSAAPKNIDSFCGMFVNLVFAIAAQYKGAVATPGLFVSMDWFLRKEYGDNYYNKTDIIITSEHVYRRQTIQGQIHQYFQQICYSLMQPSGSRGNQAVFWNCSIFDKPFFETMYGDFYYPDNTKAKWESINWLQKDFLHWLNVERLKCILTFPVVSVCLIYQNGEFLDKELYEYACEEYAQGNSFFTYISDSADSLSSCCRLSSKISKPQFNFTNGQLSEMTGSKNVITLDMNRIIQDCDRAYGLKQHGGWEANTTFIVNHLKEILERIYKYQTAYNEILKGYSDLLTVYKAGFIDMKKQYLTIGINGLNQAAEYLGMQCNKNKEYEEFCNLIFTTIKEQNQKHKTKELMFNSEFTPCESASIKLYNRDKADGYWVPTDTNLYASYIFKPNDSNISILDKIYLHGRNFCGDNLDGRQNCLLYLCA
jgi:ribonucleoside-triphosphate reductase (formate)